MHDIMWGCMYKVQDIPGASHVNAVATSKWLSVYCGFPLQPCDDGQKL